LAILQEGNRNGRTETICKYHIAPWLYDRWRRKYLAEGIEGLKNKHKQIDPHFRQVAVNKAQKNKSRQPDGISLFRYQIPLSGGRTAFLLSAYHH
jgi:hypothetical protein